MGNCTYDVLLQGSPFCDLTFTFGDRDELPPLGQEVFAEAFAVNPGGIFNIAAALSMLGLRVGLMAQLGNDIFSRFVAERMEACGLSRELVTFVDMPLPVVTTGISFPHDRLFISYQPPDGIRPPAPRITIETLDRYQPRVLFSYAEHDPAVYRHARGLGIFTYVDTAWRPDSLRSLGERKAVSEIDVIAPNLPEALEMTGATTAEAALRILGRLAHSVIIKMGGAGCVGLDEGRTHRVGAIPVRAIETTGAGDNFNAGFLYGKLRGYDFEDCLRCGNIAGGLSTESMGGCAMRVTPNVVESWLHKLREKERRSG